MDMGGIIKDMYDMDGLIRQKKELYDNSKIEHNLLRKKLNQQNSELFKEVYNDNERINNDEYYKRLHGHEYQLDYLVQREIGVSKLESNVDVLSPLS